MASKLIILYFTSHCRHLVIVWDVMKASCGLELDWKCPKPDIDRWNHEAVMKIGLSISVGWESGNERIRVLPITWLATVKGETEAGNGGRGVRENYMQEEEKSCISWEYELRDTGHHLQRLEISY